MTTEQRLERLERKIRWMRRIGAVGLAIVAAIAVWPRSRDPKVNSLQVTDKNGTERMWLVTDVDGTPGLVLHDAKGNMIWRAPR